MSDLQKLWGLLNLQDISPPASAVPESVAMSASLEALEASPGAPRAARSTSTTARLKESMEQPDDTPALIEALQQKLQEDPQGALEAAPAQLGPEPTVADAYRLLDEARRAATQPELTYRTLESNRREGVNVSPDSVGFTGPGNPAIRIDPNLRKFEDRADAAAWALTASKAWGFRLVHKKPPLPLHTTASSRFCYPLKAAGDKATVALFSDWGSGYYHSRYIAWHIARLGAMQAIHLGDVYYTGTKQEFSEHFEPILDSDIVKTIPFFAMNANHEMDTHGIAYLDYLRRKRERGGQPGFVAQPQEGSYFCLDNAHYQVIGIDTAYWKNGRCRAQDAGCDRMRAWLEERLRSGRQQGKVNILLSQNEPYMDKRRDLLGDLDFVLGGSGQGSLVDLWFWGDEHFCALYPPTERTPFIGSCIGHGGYPYDRKTQDWFGRHFVKPA
ncbi:hypothetical protein ACLESO_02320 [Pyxidicoccus sp. 3LG]